MTPPRRQARRRPSPDLAAPKGHSDPRARQSRQRGARGLGGEQVEGRQAVAELLGAGRRRVTDVWMDDGVEPAAILDRITELAARRRVPVRRVNRGRMAAEARTESPQGVLAHADPLAEADFEELCERRYGKPAPFLVAFDGVTDPQNLGALLRTADGAGVSGAVLPRHRSAHVTPAVTKAAAGAIEHVPMTVVSGIPAALARASEMGLWTVGLDPTADQSIFELSVADQSLVVVLGAEGKGLSRLAANRCDVLARIPLVGSLDSLNVSAAGAIALFEVSRRRAQSNPLTA